MADASGITPDRRPIAARNWRWSQRLADALVRLGASPNAISLAGMVCGMLAGSAFAATPQLTELGLERGGFLAAALFIQLRLLANMLDGMVALGSGRASPVGELYNEVPDRVSDTAIFVGAGYAVGGLSALGYGAACVALFTAYLRAAGKAAGAANEFCGPMAKQQRMFVMTVAALYAGLAPQSWQPTWGQTAPLGLIAAALVVIIILGLVTAWRRLVRIAAQLRANRP